MLLALFGTKTLVTPSFLSAGTGGTEAPLSGTLQVPYPATVAANNFLVCHVYAEDGGDVSNIDVPAGWTAVAAMRSSGDLTHATRAFYKVASGSESGNLDVTIGAAGVFAAGRIYRFSHGSGIEAAGSATTDTSGTGMTCVDVTTLGVNRCAVQLFAADVNTTIGNIAGESNADYTEAVAEYATSSATMSCQTAAIAAAVAITGGSATLGAAGTYRQRIGFAITP